MRLDTCLSTVAHLIGPASSSLQALNHLVLTGVDQRTTFDLAMAEMHAGQEELDRIGDAINEARNKHIATGGKNLKEVTGPPETYLLLGLILESGKNI